MRAALLLLLFFQIRLFAQSPEMAVRAVLDQQTAAWNQGDLTAFVRTYSADAIFVGKEISRGAAGLLERYRRDYPNRERMGTLTFTDIEVRMLGQRFATVLGRFHLQRSASGGGAAHGIFTLVLQRQPAGWKIVLDHSS